MKNFALYFFLFLIALVNTNCEVVGGIFKAGMVWGILLVIIIVATIIALLTKSKK